MIPDVHNFLNVRKFPFGGVTPKATPRGPTTENEGEKPRPEPFFHAAPPVDLLEMPPAVPGVKATPQKTIKPFLGSPP